MNLSVFFYFSYMNMREHPFVENIEYVTDYRTRRDETKMFLSLLHPDSESMLIWAWQGADKIVDGKEVSDKWCQVNDKPYCYPNHDNEKNTYVSVNEFPDNLGTYTMPKDKDAVLIRGIFLDTDAHNAKELDEKGNKIPLNNDEIDLACEKILEMMDKETKKGNMPEFNIVNLTGRGVGKYYVYKEPVKATDEYRLRLHDALYKAIQDRFKGLVEEYGLDEYGAEEDCCVSNPVRVCRAPGYLNTKSGRYNTLYSINRNTYTLEELCEFFGVKEKDLPEKSRILTANIKAEEEKEVKKNPKEKKKTDKGKNKKKGSSSKKSLKQLTAVDYKKASITYNCARTRLRQINQIMDRRGGYPGNKRHNALWLYWQNLKIVYPEDIAKEYLYDLNNSFAVPFDNAEVNKIINQYGDYCHGAKAFSDALSLTSSEEEMIGLYDRQNKEKKYKENTEKKTEKAKEFLILMNQGFKPAEIAKKLDMNIRTVYNWIKKLPENVSKEANESIKNDEKNFCEKTPIIKNFYHFFRKIMGINIHSDGYYNSLYGDNNAYILNKNTYIGDNNTYSLNYNSLYGDNNTYGHKINNTYVLNNNSFVEDNNKLLSYDKYISSERYNAFRNKILLCSNTFKSVINSLYSAYSLSDHRLCITDSGG